MRKLTFITVIALLLCDIAWADNLVWPPPPEKPRIQFMKTIIKPADIGIKKSFLKKLWEFVAGDEPEGMIRPYGIAVKGDKIFITDVALAGFHVFDLSRNNYKIINPKPIRAPSPLAVTFSGSERVMVADSMLKKILIFASDGKFEGEFAAGFPFQRPTAISVSPIDNAVWVTDTLAQQVLKFSSKGEKLLALGKRGDKKGEFNYPTGITVGKDGKVYVCDTLNARIQIFSPEGKFLVSFGKHGDSTGDFSHPKSIALDSDGNIYVVDGLFDAVQIFDEKGRLLLVFGKKGAKNGEFNVPASIFIDEKDRIFISDSYNGRLQIFQYLRES
jgi:DNA-binding beta-propeller fold protein YncE